MKRLFQVNRPCGKPLEVDGVIPYFNDKAKAKELRDNANAGLPNFNFRHPGEAYTVGYGPDHHRYT